MPPSASRLSALANLPAFPGIALEVLNIATTEDADVRKLAGLIEKDPAFSSDILRMANAPIFSLRGGIKSITHAIAQIGLDHLTSATMTVAVRSVASGAFRTPVARQCWQHSLACGVLAQHFSRSAGVAAAEAYTMGLLHDIGRLGLLAAFLGEYSQLLQQPHRSEEDLLVSEEKLFRVDHCAAGALLARNWKLPASVATVAASHHQIPADRKENATSLIYVACGVSRCLGYGLQFTEADTVADLLAVAPPRLAAAVDAALPDLNEIVEANVVALS